MLLDDLLVGWQEIEPRPNYSMRLLPFGSDENSPLKRGELYAYEIIAFDRKMPGLSIGDVVSVGVPRNEGVVSNTDTTTAASNPERELDLQEPRRVFSFWENDGRLERKFMKSIIHQDRLMKAMSVSAICDLKQRTKILKKIKEKPLKIQVWSRQQPRETKTQYKSKNTPNQHSNYNANRAKLRK